MPVKMGRGLGLLLLALVLSPASSAELSHWPIEPDRARALLQDAPFEIRAEKRTEQGTSGTRKLELYFPAQKITLYAKWKEVPSDGDGINNSPRKEIAADALQRLLFAEKDYVAPPTVLRCIPMEEVPEGMRPRKPNIAGTTCVLGTLSLWMDGVEVPEQLWSPKRFEKDADYARAMADLNLFTYMVNHRDGRSGNLLVAAHPQKFRAFAIDNGISFNSRIFNFAVMNWDSMRVPALPRDIVERLRAITPEQIDGLGVVAEVRADRSGVLRSTEHGPNLDPEEGARQAPGVMQMGLTEREIEKLHERVHEMLERIDAGKVRIF